MQVTWITIPKGTITRDSGQGVRHLLRATVLPVINQASLALSGAALPNWPGLVRDALESIEVEVGGTRHTVPINAAYLHPDVWDQVFDGRKARPPAQRKSARDLNRIADRTSDYAKAATDAMSSLVALHRLDPRRNAATALRGVPVTHLFTSRHATAAGAKAAAGAAWAEDARRGYSELGELFLPPKPGFAELRKASETRIPLRIGDDLLHAVQTTFRPPELAMRGSGAPSVFSANGLVSLSAAIDSLSLKGGAAAGFTAAGAFDHGWAQSAVRHMVSTVAYLPNHANPQAFMDARTEEMKSSESNTLGALLAEAGLLGVLGLLFDIEVEVGGAPLDGRTIVARGRWKSAQAFTEYERRTYLGPRGTPKAREDLFTEDGFMRLGRLNAYGSPEFMLTDFRFDDAIRDLQRAAQADRNSLPQYSPAARTDLVPPHRFQQMHSHELTVHWRGRSEWAKRADQPSAAEDPLYLEDLVIGARPILGEVLSDKRVRWFDLAAKKADFGILKGALRSPEDLRRDAAMAPLVSFDHRTHMTCSVSEVFMSWNGWGYGVALPGQDPAGVLRKSETPGAPLLSFRYGMEVCVGAKAVLRDGSSLPDEKLFSSALGAHWDEIDRSLIVAARSRGRIEPFRLLRWERLAAPTVLHDGAPSSPGWWPHETASRIVVATAFDERGKSRRESCRIVVPAQMSNMHSTWQHGAFDDTPPHRTAFGLHDRDPKTGGFARALLDDKQGTEQVWRLSLSNSPDAPPYHPDPLVTRFRIWAIRRLHEGTSDGLFVGEDGTPVQALFDLYGQGQEWPHARALRLKAVAVGRRWRKLFVVHESSDTLEVRIPAGEKVTLVIVPEGDPKRLAGMHAFGTNRLRSMLEKFPDVLRAYESESECERGLIDQPYLAAPVEIDVEHALERPYAAPEIRKLDLMRQPENTSAELDISTAYDIGSTAAIELYAAEERAENDLARIIEVYQRLGKVPRADCSSVLVKSFGQSEIAPKVNPDALSPPVRPLEEIKLSTSHDFYDFSHHRVVYWCRGLRAAEKDAHGELGTPPLVEGNASAANALASSVGVVHVPASRPPNAPQVRYLIPSFRFRTEHLRGSLRRTRKGELALHMDGRWPDSGPDEKLVVVLLKQTSPPFTYDAARKALNAYVSFWGADPVRQGPQAIARMPDVITAADLGCAHPIPYQLPVAVDGVVKQLIDVELVPFQPQLCVDAKSWRAEIPLDNPSAVSRPFVRLAVARFQPYALDGCMLSAITPLEYLQLSNDRELVVTRDASDDRTLHVALYGVRHDPTESLEAARLSCWLEERCSQQRDGQASWLQIASVSSWDRTVREGRACWCTSIKAAEPLNCGKYRLGVLEEEPYLIEASDHVRSGLPVYFDLLAIKELH